MNFTTRLRKSIIDLTGYWIYKHKDLPPGCDLMTDLKQRIRFPINTIFDVGANIGQTTLMFKENFQKCKIYSFEPVSDTFNKLKTNVRHLDNVHCFKLALGDKKGPVDIKIFEGEASVLNSLNEGAMNITGNLIERIEVTTGDAFCSENNISEIDLLKIDTEGYEIKVLSGFSRMIEQSKIKCIYCEVGFSPDNHRNTFINELMIFAHQKGYQFHGLYDIYNSEIKNGNHFGNVLFVRKDFL